MRKTICRKFKTIVLIVVAAATISTCFAGEIEDAVNQISSKAADTDVSKTNESNISSQTQNIAPSNMQNIDAQLKQIEQNYKAQIDAGTLQQNHDPLGADLSQHNQTSNGVSVNELKSLTDKSLATRQKIKITSNDELLVAAKNIQKATLNDANGCVVVPQIASTKSITENKILTCHEAGDEVVKKCYRTRVVKAIQPEDIKFVTEAYFAALSEHTLYTNVDLKTGEISYHLAQRVNSGSKVVNAFNTVAAGAEIISIRHLHSGWWHQSGVHTHDVNSEITNPTRANAYVYKNFIWQGSMGSSSNRERNGNKYRGRVEKWEVIAKPAPVLVESWDEGECPQLTAWAAQNFCEGPVTNLIDVEQTRMIANYPLPVKRMHWQEEHIYTCGGGSHANECQMLHEAGCTQIDSKCISTKGPFCVEYLQTFNCGKKQVISNLSADGGTITIAKTDNLGANDGFEVEDFGSAVGQLAMIDELKKNILRPSDGAVLLFKGDRLTCDKDWGSDIKNCCNLKGIFKNIIGHKCPKEVEEILAPAVVRQRRCIEVAGWQCIAKTLGKCRKWRKSFCCYQSRLARIFQQIAHHQLGIGWGSAQAPNCGPLDPHTFGRLNFDDPYAKSLLKELVDEASVNAQNYANRANTKLIGADLTNKVVALQEKMSAYYANKTNASGDKQ